MHIVVYKLRNTVYKAIIKLQKRFYVSPFTELLHTTVTFDK